jgi:hypothetical protein
VERLIAWRDKDKQFLGYVWNVVPYEKFDWDTRDQWEQEEPKYLVDVSIRDFIKTCPLEFDWMINSSGAHMIRVGRFSKPDDQLQYELMFG